MQIAEAFVAVRPRTDGFEADAQRQLGTPLKNLAAGAASAFAAVKVKDLFTGFIDEAREAEKVGRLTEAVLKSTGGAANVTAGDVDNLATRLSKVAAVDDDLIQKGANVLLTFTQVRNEAGKGNDVFNQGVEAALNLSSALDQDLQGSILLVGKALNDPITGMTALRRAGVQLTEAQQEQVKAFVEAGDVLSAQKIILGELEAQFGGAARAAADPAQRLSVEWANLQEQLGTQLLPVLNAVVGGVGEGIEVFSNLPAPVQQSVLAFVALAAVSGPLLTIGGNLRTIVDVATSIPSTVKRGADAILAMGASGVALGGVIGAIAAIGFVAANSGESVREGLLRAVDDLATKSAGDLVDAFDKGGRSLGDFELLAERNVGAAIRLRDELKRQGETTTDLDRIIQRYVDKQRNAQASTDAAAAAVGDEDAALAGLIPTVEDTTDALQDLLDVTLAVFDADLNYEQQVNRTEDALASYHETAAEVMKTRGEDREATEAQERATLDAADAVLALADAAVEHADRQAAANDETLTAADRARIQRDELQRVADTLAPGSPLRQRLDEYIFGLAQIPSSIVTTIEQRFVSVGPDGVVVRQGFEAQPVNGRTPTVESILGLIGGSDDPAAARRRLDELKAEQSLLPERLKQARQRLARFGKLDTLRAADGTLLRRSDAEAELKALIEANRTIEDRVQRAQVDLIQATSRQEDATSTLLSPGSSVYELEQIARRAGLSQAEINSLMADLRSNAGPGGITVKNFNLGVTTREAVSVKSEFARMEMLAGVA